ncbi:hypothetical protein [Noviherbaspirillum massiliense]|uniref:hypothetical protein n=1 Tax=Noviherbaspirillum massiliense TaxID=1465823 RepID=UPI0002DF6354|nr:hypothetical protein [Noviherbaspirillum massiliense]
MQSIFQASDSGQAVIRNATATGTEQLVVTLHPGSDSSVDIEIREDVPGSGLVSSSISINQSNLQRLVQWLRDQDAVD